MGSIYPRHQPLWLKFKNEKGSWVCRPSGLKVGQEKKAKDLLKRIETLVEVGGAAPGGGSPIYSRDEIERIIVDERIPSDRRMYNALLLLAGIRFGEASALRWRHYDSEIGPLGKLILLCRKLALSTELRLLVEDGLRDERGREASA